MSKIKTWSEIKKIELTVIIVWVILAIIFGISDLVISIAVVDESSIWGNFGDYWFNGCKFIMFLYK
ncbi:unnamed protein product [marine sediment metagenome]|uniref:Uncharacterized protein n=1 Tax=marine sediment metagenome TaxID=412755 RepID=X1FKV4_9ZZZZ